MLCCWEFVWFSHLNIFGNDIHKIVKRSYLKRGKSELKRSYIKRKPPKKRKKVIDKKSTRYLRKKLRKIFSEYVRRKEKGVCFTCEKIAKARWQDTHCGHFYHRDALDYSEEGNHAQCVGCNLFRRGNLVAYAVKLEKTYGVGIIQKLKKEGDQIKRWKVGELQELIKTYEKKVKKLH